MLQNQMESIPLSSLERVNRPGGLATADLLDFLIHPRDYTVDMSDDESPDIMCDDIPQEVVQLGEEAVRRGEVAFCVLSGGVGTRVGMSKAFLKTPGTKTSLIGLKMLQSDGYADVWIMSSPANHDALVREKIVRERRAKIFQQYESFRLRPDNTLYFSDGSPSMHPCGHGDVVSALKHSGLLYEFLARGGKYIVTVNVDNLYAAPDPRLIGQHIVSRKPVTCEVVRHQPCDVGGVLCMHDGFRQIVEKFRLSGQTDPDSYSWLSTNSMIFDAGLDFDAIKWSWHRVKKQVDGELVIQYERLMQDMTSHFQTQFIGVKRETRYVPIKTPEDIKTVAHILCKNVA